MYGYATMANRTAGLQVVRCPYSHLRLVCLPSLYETTSPNVGRDESFNSITGLNGSGKSNILDSICFVLGINNLSVVRAQNLQVRDLGIHTVRGLTSSTGSHLQARTSWSHESERDHRIRQPRQIKKPRRLRGACADFSHTANRAGRSEQIPHQWTPSTATEHTEPLPISAA